MAFKKIPLTIDTMIRNPVPIEGINQEDNIELNIVVTENKTPKDLSSQTIKVYVRRIDGTLVEQTNQITPTNARKGEVTVKLKNSAFNKEGYALFQLDISDSSGRITSSYATFKVGKGLVSGEAIANTNEIEALKKVEEYIKKANQELEIFKQTVVEINENEATRQENEVVRVRKEASRNEAEAIRTQQEATRKEKENERVQAETKRIADEEVRRENEVLRGSKELERKQAEELRKEKELLRIADENNRKVAESKRIEAESVRVEAEKLRVAAETGRVEAESLRVTAEEERVAAETKREEGFNKFEGKINANTKELKAARSATTGEKFNTLDERIDCEVDRLNKKIEVSFLQQEDKENHVIENTIEGMTTDMVIKGRTLMNMVKLGNVSNDIGILGSTVARYSYCYNLKNNIDYTIIFEIENKTDDNQVAISLNAGTIGSRYSVRNGVNVLKVRSANEFNTEIWFYYHSDNVDGSGSVKNIIVLEGDWTNKPIPKYFEGIKSFGEQESNKISILSHGKNLCKTIESGGILFADYGDYNDKKYLRTKYIGVENMRHLARYMDGESNEINLGAWYFYDNKKNAIKPPLYGDIVEVPPSACFVRVEFSSKQKVDISEYRERLKFIICEGNAKPETYEHYKEDKKDILIKEPLHEGNYLYEDNGQIKVYKEAKKYIFTGDEFITKENTLINITRFYIDTQCKNKVNTRNIICDNFNSNGTWWDRDEIGMYWDTIVQGRLWFHISKTKFNDVESFKNFLKANPTTIIYELDTPTVEVVEDFVNIDLKTFNEKTYVSFENAISGTSSFKAPVDTTATIARLNRENRALEEENKTLRQDFESTTLSLTDSDLELVKQNVDIDFRLMEVEFALDIPQSTLSSNINFKKKGEVKSMARTPYQMMKIVILGGDYDREDYIHKVGKYYERGKMTKEEYDELMSLMTADEVIGE